VNSVDPTLGSEAGVTPKAAVLVSKRVKGTERFEFISRLIPEKGRPLKNDGGWG